MHIFNYKRRKLGSLPGTAMKSIQACCFPLDGWEGLKTRLEYHVPLKKGFILQSKARARRNY